MAPKSKPIPARRVRYTDPPLYHYIEQPATAAVISTNELLTQILSEVPLENRVDLRRVCKTWNDIISKVGFQAKPVEARCCGTQEVTVPHYSTDIVYKVNLVCNHIEVGFKVHREHELVDPTSIDGNAVDATLYPKIETPAEISEFDQRGSEFITKPPITRAMVQIIVPAFPHAVEATLWVPEGIRNRDLLQTFTKMKAHSDWTINRPRLNTVIKRRMKDRAYFVVCRRGEDDEGA